MINPDNDLFVWGPIDGRPVYVSYFMTAINRLLPKTYLYGLPEIIFFFQKTKMTFITDFTELRDSGKKHFMRWLMDNNGLNKIKTDYDKAVKCLKDIQNKITKDYLDSLSDRQFRSVYIKWHSAYLKFWGVGLVPEIANWGGEQLLKEKLQKITKDEKEFSYLMEKLTAPENFSFYQIEELDLLKIRKYKKDRFDQLIQRHTARYLWIRNSYFEQKILKEDYFMKQLSKSTLNEANKRIKEIKSIPIKAKNIKRLLFKRYNLSNEIQKISKRLSYSIWWQDSRKAQIFTANHYIDLFIKQASKRFKIPILNLKFYSDSDLKNLIEKDKKVSKDILAERKKKCVFHHYPSRLQFKTGDRINKLIKPFITKKADKKTKEIKGTVVSAGSGNVVGKVRLLLTPRNIHLMEKGDILVTTMTSPDFILAMKKASAIVTNEGGMTSHAAIVSRELKIPCIVGTKTATKVLKTGMLVEINCNHGVVKILK